MTSSFIEQAQKEVAAAPIVAGEAQADALLAQCRSGIYHWPAGFAGFLASLRYDDGPSSFEGSLLCAGSRRLELNLPGLEETRWLRFQVEEMISHREAPEVSRMASKTGCALGDWDAIYGRRIDFLGDKMESFYRIREGKLCQIGRAYKKERFVINIDTHQLCDGRWAASCYTAFYWSKLEGALLKTETYLDSYEEWNGVFLPAERRVSEASSAGLRHRRLTLSDFRPL